jgi:ATP-dependent protease ClpP protease subunit/predicted chitinase
VTSARVGGWEETVSAAAFVRDLNALDVEQITVRINSIGSSVPDGLAIFNAIRRHKATVTTEVDGMAFSIASLIAMAGDTVNMASNAMLMVHAPWTYAAGNSAQLREMADQLDTWAAAMSTSYAMRTGDQPAMLALLTDGKDHYYTAQQALDQKFIDAVTDAMPVSASAARDPPLNRYRSLPAALQAAGTFAAAAAPSPEPFMLQATLPAAAPNPAHPAAAVAAAPPAAAAQVDAAAVLAADQQRRAGIRSAFANYTTHEGVQALQRECEDDHAITPEAAGLRLLAHVGRSMAPAAGGRIITLENERDKSRAAAVNSILARASVAVDAKGPVRADAANPLRGRKLLAIAEACLAQAGVRTEGMDQCALVAAAFTQSGSDFPLLLENVMHKTLLGAYAIQPDTWTLFVARPVQRLPRAQPISRGQPLQPGGQERARRVPQPTIPDGCGLQWSTELWGPTPEQKRYERDLGAPWPPKSRTDRNWKPFNLGNSEPGDGSLFRDHGWFQSTGRANLAAARDRLRRLFPELQVPDFELEPALLASPRWAALCAADYVDMRDLNAWADAGDFDGYCDVVNLGRRAEREGDSDGWLERVKPYASGRIAMGLA